MEPETLELTVRKLQTEDADAISEIYSLITQKVISPKFTEVVREHASQEKNEGHFVSVFNGQVVGFMISYLLPLGFGADKNAYIATMGVHPKYMGQGVGRKMAQEIFNLYHAMGIKNVYTSVRWDSTDLLSFCKTLGFERSEFINLQMDI